LAPGALQSRLDFLSQHPDELAVTSLPARLIDDSGKTLAEFDRITQFYKNFPDRLTLDFYRQGNFFPVFYLLKIFRKEVFDLIGLFSPEFTAADADFHFRLLQKTPIPVLRLPAVIRRLHKNNDSLILDNGNLRLAPKIIRDMHRINQKFGIPNTDM